MGDYVGGDKIGGDKVTGDKIVASDAATVNKQGDESVIVESLPVAQPGTGDRIKGRRTARIIVAIIGCLVIAGFVIAGLAHAMTWASVGVAAVIAAAIAAFISLAL
ncbi:MAG TPA: hypothetical protein VH063_10685 [Gaiellaceae bacterium]|jgi:hypothetical protein|nr:hypothetical protein [Gaiellaceae bacterium]